MKEQQGDVDQVLSRLIRAAREVARGRVGKPEEIFELTKNGRYPPLIVDLAESFGMMIVKIESREYQLELAIEDLRKVNAELDQAHRELACENVHLRRNLRQKFSPGRIIGQNRKIHEILAIIDKIADTPVNVLISGETGTGKELIAKAIHYNSFRSDKPFVALNCSALPEALVESELFGIERGVATGVERRMGRIEQANGGTLFLDEIGDMPLSSQAKILRVIEEQEVERLGGRKAVPVDVRLLAASNKDLKKEIQNGDFREDLFYRLNVVHIHLPALRERKDDIPLLLKTFLDYHAPRLGRGVMKADPKVLEWLMKYDWPGNIRQFENEIERAVVLSCTDTITAMDLSDEVRDAVRGQSEAPAPGASNLAQVEQETIRRVLKEVNGNKSRAAKLLGMSREGLRRKLLRYGIS